MKVQNDPLVESLPFNKLLAHYRIEKGKVGIKSVTYSEVPVDNDVADPLIKEADNQIKAYLSNERNVLDFSIEIQGTAFQKSVYEAILNIPYGHVWTYKDVAVYIGKPNAQRAVGSALNKNPLSLVVPCHRVVGSKGRLVGFGSGLPVKKTLLKLEGIL